MLRSVVTTLIGGSRTTSVRGVAQSARCSVGTSNPSREKQRAEYASPFAAAASKVTEERQFVKGFDEEIVGTSRPRYPAGIHSCREASAPSVELRCDVHPAVRVAVTGPAGSANLLCNCCFSWWPCSLMKLGRRTT